MIRFRSVSSKNFFSIGGHPIKILLDKSPTTLISGKNGSGKTSTILDSINFALFGKPFRNINKPLVINSINNGDCLVELEFDTGSNQYLIRRGLKPNIFEIYENGELINQDASARDYQRHLEDHILGGLNERVFKQVVIIGSADYRPFMALPAAQRREVIEELLDIKIFSQMLTLAKEKIGKIKETLRQMDYDVELQEEKIRLQKNARKRLKEEHKEKASVLSARIEEHQVQIGKSMSEIETLQNDKAKIEAELKVEDVIKKAIKKLEKLSADLHASHKATDKTLKFFENNENCPTCKQEIAHTHKQPIIDKSTEHLLSLKDGIKKIETEMGKKKKLLEVVDKYHNKISLLERSIYQYQTDISSRQRSISNLQKEIKELESNKYTSNIDEVLKELEEALTQLKEKRIALIEEKQYNEIVADMLKDEGIKTKVIKQYVPVMNKIVNDYLQRLGLPIEFTLDEQFNETIKSRFRDKFSYNNFSEGEKSRIDTALLLTWRQIARAKNTTNCNLLVFDETFDSSLDSSATEELLNILLEMDKDTNIFIVSHKTDLGDKVRSLITFEKVGNFTSMVV